MRNPRVESAGDEHPDSMMERPSAIVFAAHPWAGVPYGLHHMARALARLGWQVLYVEPFFSPLHLIGGRRRGRVLGMKPRPTDQSGVSVLSPFTLAPHANLPLLRSSTTLRLARHLCWPRLGTASFSGTPFANPDLILCGFPPAAEIALSLNAKLKLYRLADDSSLFDVLTPATRQAEFDAIPRFDGVIVTSDALVTRAHQLKARQTVLVTNGVDRALFETPSSAPVAMTELPEPRVLYAGAVEDWFDWPLVIDAALKRPEFSFAIVGRIGAPPPGSLPANVHLLGQRPYSEMPAFMQAASVGIIPFASRQHDEAVRAINPLKLYEYLAAGCPVVTSVRPPNLQCDGLFTYEDQVEFVRDLDRAIEMRRQGVKITAPGHVDWTEIVREMLEKFEHRDQKG